MAEIGLMNFKGLVRQAGSFVLRAAGRRPNARVAAMELVRTSGLFDDDWYRLEYPDVSAAGVDPLRHYMTVGWQEGRNPGPEFSSLAYLRANPDVARSGNNPLVHYIEFGQSEGREAFGHRPAPRAMPLRSFDFPAPSPVFSVTRPVGDNRASRPHDQSGVEGPENLPIRSQDFDLAAGADTDALIRAARACLMALSGHGDPSLHADDWFSPWGQQTLVDAWFATSARLRTRWTVGGAACVITAYQADPLANGEVRQVGRGPVASALDLFDLQLRNRYFPVLLIFTSPDGAIAGARILPFPSMCRGGLHYPELLDASERSGNDPNPLERGDKLADQLMRLLTGQATPGLNSISVDLSGADGTGPLFQPDFRAWLEKVVRVDLRPGKEDTAVASAPYFADALLVQPAAARAGGSTLVLRSNMVPTIDVLTRAKGQPEAKAQALLRLLIAGADPAEPAISVELPAQMMSVLAATAHGAADWPLLRGATLAGADVPAGAIKVARRTALTDAELFFPVTVESGALEARRAAITWLVQSDDWVEPQLLAALECLALQSGGENDCLSLIGRTVPRLLHIATRAFGSRAKRYPDLAAAQAELETTLCGYLGAGVILHDNRCASSLAGLLAFPEVATASCPLIAVEPTATAWSASILSGGALLHRKRRRFTRLEELRIAEQLWRSIYPVAGPPPEFWLAKSTWARSTAGAPDLPGRPDSLHLCSALVTASLMNGAAQSGRPAVLPPSRRDDATIVEVLFG